MLQCSLEEAKVTVGLGMDSDSTIRDGIEGTNHRKWSYAHNTIPWYVTVESRYTPTIQNIASPRYLDTLRSGSSKVMHVCLRILVYYCLRA